VKDGETSASSKATGPGVVTATPHRPSRPHKVVRRRPRQRRRVDVIVNETNVCIDDTLSEAFHREASSTNASSPGLAYDTNITIETIPTRVPGGPNTVIVGGCRTPGRGHPHRTGRSD
jgi:hypothetical protein